MSQHKRPRRYLSTVKTETSVPLHSHTGRLKECRPRFRWSYSRVIRITFQQRPTFLRIPEAPDPARANPLPPRLLALRPDLGHSQHRPLPPTRQGSRSRSMVTLNPFPARTFRGILMTNQRSWTLPTRRAP